MVDSWRDFAAFLFSDERLQLSSQQKGEMTRYRWLGRKEDALSGSKGPLRTGWLWRSA